MGTAAKAAQGFWGQTWCQKELGKLGAMKAIKRKLAERQRRFTSNRSLGFKVFKSPPSTSKSGETTPLHMAKPGGATGVLRPVGRQPAAKHSSTRLSHWAARWRSRWPYQSPTSGGAAGKAATRSAAADSSASPGGLNQQAGSPNHRRPPARWSRWTTVRGRRAEDKHRIPAKYGTRDCDFKTV